MKIGFIHFFPLFDNFELKEKKLEKGLFVVCYLVVATGNKTSYILYTLSNLFIFWVDVAAAQLGVYKYIWLLIIPSTLE